MAKKTYSIEWCGLAEIWIEIDHEIMTDEKLHNINNAWIDCDEKLEQANGDITEAVLKRIASECFRFIVAEDYGVEHLIRKFSDIGGYTPMDGSYGIRIVHYDSIEFDVDDMTVLIVENSDDK